MQWSAANYWSRAKRSSSTSQKLDELRSRQIEAVKYLDSVVEELFDTVPKNTYITITADHGELFGEDGYFGHGPISTKRSARFRSSKASSMTR